MPDIHCVDGLSIRSIGWIPYYKRSKDWQQLASYREYGKLGNNHHAACDGLFFSGNKTPNETIFRNQTNFENFVEESEDYRAAFSLSNVKLYLTDRGYDVKYDLLYKIGYTPLRSFIPIVNIKIPIDFVWHSQQGEGQIKLLYKNNDKDGCSFGIMGIFLITKLFRYYTRWLLTGYFPPYAWFGFEYTIKNDGSCQIKFFGSYIPSQIHYVTDIYENPVGLVGHDMRENNMAKILTMLEPGYDGSNNWFEPEIIEKAKGCYLGSVEGKGNVI